MRTTDRQGDLAAEATRAEVGLRKAAEMAANGRCEHEPEREVGPEQSFRVDEYSTRNGPGYLLREVRRDRGKAWVRTTNHGPGPFPDDTGWLPLDEDDGS